MEEKTSVTLKYRAISSAAWKFLERFGYQAVQFIVQMVLARLLSPNEFGLLSILLVFINIANVVVQSGLNTALIQQKRVSEADKSTVFWISFAIALAMVLCIELAAPLIAGFYNNNEIVVPLRVLAIVLLINSFNSVQVALVMRDLNTKRLFVSTLVSVVISGASGITLALFRAGIWSLIAQQMIYQGTSSLVLLFQVKWFPKPVFDLSRAKEMYSFGWRILLAGLIDTGYQGVYDLAIGKEFSTESLGYYSQGNKIPQTITTLIDNTIRSVLLSVAAKMQDNVAAVKGVTRRAMMTSSYVLAPLMLWMALSADAIIPVLFGNQWANAVPFMRIMCITYMFWPIHTSNLQTINALGRSDVSLRLEMIKKIVGLLILAIMIIVTHDVYYVALGKLLGSILSIFINAKPAKKLIKYSYLEQVRDIFPAYLLAGVCCLLAVPIAWLSLGHMLQAAVQFILVVAVYVTVSRAIKMEAFEYVFNAIAKYSTRRHCQIK